jgi:hypothetical protein
MYQVHILGYAYIHVYWYMTFVNSREIFMMYKSNLQIQGLVITGPLIFESIHVGLVFKHDLHVLCFEFCDS